MRTEAKTMKHPTTTKTILLLSILAMLSPLPGATGILTQQTQAAPQPTLGPGTYSLLILAPQDFTSALQPLVDHKIAMGLPTILKTLTDIDNTQGLQGRDEAEKVKYYIQAAMDQWGIHYVILVGGRNSQFKDTWWFPVRYASSADDWETQYLSDLYFADIYNATGFSTWDSNTNGLYAEWYPNQSAGDTGIDYIPDIAVGRLPARSLREVNTEVTKIITYETTAYTSTWFPTMLVAAGDTYPQSQNPNWTGAEGEFYGDEAIQNMTDFTPTRLYTSDDTFTSKNDIINAMSAGYGFVYLVGHGSPKQWGNHAYNSTAFIQGPNTNDMWKFRNQDRLPICIVSGCHNCQFDVYLHRVFNKTLRYRQEYIPECWGERSLSTSNGGMVSTIGVTGLGFTKEDKTSFKGGINELERAFFHAYSTNHSLRLGDVWATAITWYALTYPVDAGQPGGSDSWIDSKIIASWELLGDPSLQIGGYP
jgi:hypothetical protein